MVTATRVSDGLRVRAKDADKAHRPWACPECLNEVVLKQGRIRTPHFAHKPPACAYALGETEAHRQCKEALFDALRIDARVRDCELERKIDGLRPDVSMYVWVGDNWVPFAIEVQVSKLSPGEIERRSGLYATMGIAVLWLAQWSDRLEEERYAPAQWERWLHAAQFGRVYFWRGGRLITPVHFGEHYTWVEERTWYTSEGDMQSAGGFDKLSKRYRTPVPAPTLDILDGFRPSSRTAWTNHEFNVPAFTLWADSLRKWWA